MENNKEKKDPGMKVAESIKSFTASMGIQCHEFAYAVKLHGGRVDSKVLHLRRGTNDRRTVFEKLVRVCKSSDLQMVVFADFNALENPRVQTEINMFELAKENNIDIRIVAPTYSLEENLDAVYTFRIGGTSTLIYPFPTYHDVIPQIDEDDYPIVKNAPIKNASIFVNWDVPSPSKALAKMFEERMTLALNSIHDKIYFYTLLDTDQ